MDNIQLVPANWIFQAVYIDLNQVCLKTGPVDDRCNAILVSKASNCIFSSVITAAMVGTLLVYQLTLNDSELNAGSHQEISPQEPIGTLK